MTPFDQFREAVASVAPRAAVVFGSGLSDASSPFVASASIPFADVPGLVPPTVAGHKGRLSVGHWAGVPAVVSFGRVHFYEGHPWDRVTRLVQLIAEFGVKTLVLTNAAGGINPHFQAGDFMVLTDHINLMGMNPLRGAPIPGNLCASDFRYRVRLSDRHHRPRSRSR